MNGRVYDPTLGRFLSADPHIQSPYSTQSYNRYSYVSNNPLKYTDPSGYFLGGLFKSIFKAISKIVKAVSSILPGYNLILKPAVRALAKIPLLDAAVQGAVCFYGGMSICAQYSGLKTYALTGSLKHSLKAAASTYISAKVAKGIGDKYGHQAEFLSNEHVKKVVLHGVTQGVISEIQGGSFKTGFVSAAFTQFAAPKVHGRFGDGLSGTAVAMVVGGTASAIGGGKFANGAVSASFVWIFNEVFVPEELVHTLKGISAEVDALGIFRPAKTTKQLYKAVDAALDVNVDSAGESSLAVNGPKGSSVSTDGWVDVDFPSPLGIGGGYNKVEDEYRGNAILGPITIHVVPSEVESDIEIRGNVMNEVDAINRVGLGGVEVW